MSNIIPIQSEEHWHSLRKANCGASEVAALFGCQPDYAMSHYTLWMVKSGRMDPPQINGERPKWGLRLEEVIATAYCEEVGLTWERCGYAQHPTVRGLGATPDFIIAGSSPEPSILETKNVDWLINKRQWGDEPPMHILLQLQAQLACTGYDGGVVAALVGGNELKHWRFERRPKLIAEIERRVMDFWRSIDEGREPPIDGSKSTYSAVKAMMPEAGDNSSVEMVDDWEFAELCDSVAEAKAAIKERQESLRKAEASLMQRLSGAQRAYGMGWAASIVERKGTPERVITEDMVGQTLPGRKGSISLQVREITNV